MLGPPHFTVISASMPLPIAVLASHEGTTLQAVLDACAAGRIPARVCLVISNNGDSGALRRARAAGVPARHLSAATLAGPARPGARAGAGAGSAAQTACKAVSGGTLEVSRTGPAAPEEPVRAALDETICAALEASGAGLVLLAGYMKALGPVTLRRFAGRVLNTHPALLPKFGGRGMFGIHVHEAVLAAGEDHSGASIHLVEAQYDTGAVLAQASVPVQPGDSPRTLAARVQATERELLVEVLGQIARLTQAAAVGGQGACGAGQTSEESAGKDSRSNPAADASAGVRLALAGVAARIAAAGAGSAAAGVTS